MRTLLASAIRTLQLAAAGLTELVAPDGSSQSISLKEDASLEDLHALCPAHDHGVSHLGRLLTAGLPLAAQWVGPGSCLRVVRV